MFHSSIRVVENVAARELKKHVVNEKQLQHLQRSIIEVDSDKLYSVDYYSFLTDRKNNKARFEG